MPAEDDIFDDHGLMQSNKQLTDESYSTADESAASILKSVKAQEVQFEKLTRELEAERDSVTNQGKQHRLGSDSGSMTSADDSYLWRVHPSSNQNSYYDDEPSQLADTSKMSSHLLDSCLRELEDRGTLNTGYVREDSGMEYIREDPYSSHYNTGMGYGGVSYGNQNISYEREHSPHGSHVSLQSTGSNRGRKKVTTVNQIEEHVDVLPHEQQNGNYSTYQSIDRGIEDAQHSPYQRSVSPRGQDPRFSSSHLPEHYPDAPAHYGSSPRGSLAHYRDGPGDADHYDGYIYRDSQFPGSGGGGYNAPSDSEHFYHSQQQPAYQEYEDKYPDNYPVDDPHGMEPERYPEDANRSYGEVQYQDQIYEDDSYREPPRYDEHDDASRDIHSSYGGNPDDSYHRPPEDPGYRNSFQDPPNESYGSRTGEDYSRVSDIIPLGNEPQYGGSYHSYQDDQANDPRDQQYKVSYVEDSNDAYGDRHENPYGGPVDQQDRDDPRYRSSYPGHPDDPYSSDDPELIRRMQGLPPLRQDPFADDPFQDGRDPGLHVEDEDPYRHGPSPSHGLGSYEDKVHQPAEESYHDGGQPYDSSAPPHYDYNDEPAYPEDDIQRRDVPSSTAPPMNDYGSEGRRTPPGSRAGSFRWRNPDLQEVIDYLSHKDDDIKAHAAAYLQHLTFMDDGIKAKTRGLDGIRPLIILMNNEYPEVHKSACGALQNLSYGKTNDENKKAIRNEGGIPELIRLLRKSHEDDVRETVTGVLWNLSSCEDLKKAVIDDGLTVLVNVVILPHSGVDRLGAAPYRDHEPWTTTFRNATGVLRNVSSAGFDARKKLRECHGLVKAMIHTLKIAAEGDMDNKPVENVVCILRNLSYRIQEIEDPDFYKKRTLPRQQRPPEKGTETTGCFGGGGKNKKGASKKGSEAISPNPKAQPLLPPQASHYKGLWGPEVVHLYSLLLKSAANPVTLEAAAGAVQNLTACDWQPAVDIRALVRKEKGLPNLVDLLTFENDRVVCAAATALRNLAIDERNKELVGKYAMQQLVRKLPQHRHMPGPVAPDDTLCAVIATLYEVIKNNQDFAQSLMAENGINRLLNITKSEGQYLVRTVKYAHTVLRTMWGFRALHPEYTKMGLAEKDFLMFTASTRPEGAGHGNLCSSISPLASNHTTPYNTLNRPISAQGYDDNTLSPGRPLQKRPNDNYDYRKNDVDFYSSVNQGHSPPPGNNHDRQTYSHDRKLDEIPMADFGPGYAPIENESCQPLQRSKPPPIGGVPLFPSVPQHDPADPTGEPLYAKVNKKTARGRNDDYMQASKVMLDAGGGPQGGADSWV